MTRVVSEEQRFQAVVADVLKSEGGFVNDPADRGGATNLGWSLRTLAIEGKIDLDHDGFADFDLDRDGDIDGVDIRLLTVADAKALYRRCFWDRYKCGALPAPLDGALFDQAVNGGGKAAAKMLQRAINTVMKGRKNYPLLLDGDIGPKTLGGLRAARKLVPIAKLLSLYREEAIARYRAIVAADPKQQRFLKGWINRALRLGNV